MKMKKVSEKAWRVPKERTWQPFWTLVPPLMNRWQRSRMTGSVAAHVRRAPRFSHLITECSNLMKRYQTLNLSYRKTQPNSDIEMELKAKEREINDLRFQFRAMEMEMKRTQNERDGLLTAIRALQTRSTAASISPGNVLKDFTQWVCESPPSRSAMDLPSTSLLTSKPSEQNCEKLRNIDAVDLINALKEIWLCSRFVKAVQRCPQPNVFNVTFHTPRIREYFLSIGRFTVKDIPALLNDSESPISFIVVKSAPAELPDTAIIAHLKCFGCTVLSSLQALWHWHREWHTHCTSIPSYVSIASETYHGRDMPNMPATQRKHNNIFFTNANTPKHSGSISTTQQRNSYQI